MMRILITGASGKTGKEIIQASAARGGTVRALVHRAEQSESVKGLGAQEVLCGDMRSRDVLDRALRNVQTVYHICPNMSPDEFSIGKTIIQAAQAAGVEHFVYHSVLHPQVEAMPHHWQKLRVEEYLFESGLNFTILQPAVYMQNVLAYWDRIKAGVYPVPYACETRLGMVDVDDVAAAAAVVLGNPAHFGATYELVGSEPLSQVEVARILSDQLGFAVQALAIPRSDWEKQARLSGMDDYPIETLLKMFTYYEKYGFWGSLQVLGWLLGRKPTDFASFIRRFLG